MAINTQNNSLSGLLNANPQNNTSSVLNTVSNDEGVSSKNYSAGLAHSGDRVSISYRANKLQEIGQQFFSGSIHSSDIGALTQSLYEGGFLTEEEFMSLGGQVQQVSITSQAANFLNAYMGSGEALSKEDSEQIVKAINVIENMNENPTDEQRVNEQQALAFMTGFSEELAANNADESVQEGFNMVLSVLTSLEKIRTGQVDVEALNSYQDIQNITE